VFFLGASPESAEQAMVNLRKQYPTLVIAGHYSPPFKPLLEMDHEEIKRRILSARPDLLFVGFGCPKQEKWMAMNYRSLRVPVMVGVGATIDFLAGQVRRAPLWMQRSGVEWVFRLAQEPRRLLGRYLTDLWVFGLKIVAQWWRMHSRRSRLRPGHKPVAVQSEPDWQSVKLPEILDLQMVHNNEHLVAQILVAGSHCFLEMSQVTFVDSTGLGLLVRLQKKLREINRRLILISPSSQVRNILELLHLQELFCVAANHEAARQIIASSPDPRANSHVWTNASHDLRWQGEITACNADEVWRKTLAHLSRVSSSPEFVIDLSDVTFIDSSGLGIMLRARKMAQRQGRHLVFSGVPSVVRNVLRIARLERLVLEDEPQSTAVSEKTLLTVPSTA
jgi:N-acetylglucosaminyldiphosphoundecaprenol N-acetyl-beta-D-mannosaminyltransferase